MVNLRTIGGSDERLVSFFDNSFLPAFDDVYDWARTGIQELEVGFQDEIAVAERTLSPSDFGFHNAIKTAEGNIIYVDFEYFGRDDPVKLTADFLLHPAMSLSDTEKSRFAQGVGEIFKDYRDFLTRLQYLMPLYGLRWSLIVLNEYLPSSWARRTHAGAAMTHEQAKARQLQKAEKMVSWIHNNFQDLGGGVGSSG